MMKKAEKAEKAAAAAAAAAAKKADKEKKEKEEAAKKAVSKSRSNDQLDGPSLGGALGLGFLGITAVDDEPEPIPQPKPEPEPEPEPKPVEEEATAKKKAAAPLGMSVADLSAALMAELRGLEDRVEVIGGEEGPIVALKLGAALEAIRQEPFKSI